MSLKKQKNKVKSLTARGILGVLTTAAVFAGIVVPEIQPLKAQAASNAAADSMTIIWQRDGQSNVQYTGAAEGVHSYHGVDEYGVSASTLLLDSGDFGNPYSAHVNIGSAVNLFAPMTDTDYIGTIGFRGGYRFAAAGGRGGDLFAFDAQTGLSGSAEGGYGSAVISNEFEYGSGTSFVYRLGSNGENAQSYNFNSWDTSTYVLDITSDKLHDSGFYADTATSYRSYMVTAQAGSASYIQVAGNEYIVAGGGGAGTVAFHQKNGISSWISIQNGQHADQTPSLPYGKAFFNPASTAMTLCYSDYKFPNVNAGRIIGTGILNGVQDYKGDCYWTDIVTGWLSDIGTLDNPVIFDKTYPGYSGYGIKTETIQPDNTIKTVFLPDQNKKNDVLRNESYHGDPMIQLYCSYKIVTINDPIRENYQFKGWTNLQNCEVISRGNGQTTFKVTDTNSQIEAEWEADFRSFTMTMNHYKYNPSTAQWDYFAVTYDTALYGTIYIPAYSKTPEHYHNHSRDWDSGWTVVCDGIFNVYYAPDEYTMTVHHYTYNIRTENWDYLTTTYDTAYYGAVYTPPYSKTPQGYHNHERDWGDGWRVISDKTFHVYYYPNEYTMTVQHYAYNPNSENWDLIATAVEKALYSTVYIPPYSKTPHGYHNHHRDWDGGFTVISDKTFRVYYYPNTYMLILNKGTGIESVLGGGAYLYGKEVTIDAHVLSGYHWKNWEGTYQTEEKQYTFLMPCFDVEMTANGEANRYTINFVPNGGIAISQIESIDITYDGSISLPDTAGKFVKYTLDGMNVTSDVVNGIIDISPENPDLRQDEPTADKRAYESLCRGFGLETVKDQFTPQWIQGQSISAAELVQAAGVLEIDGAVITLYAIWDDCPWITAEHLYYTLAQAQSGFITESELLSHQTAFDREDGSPIAAGVHENGTSFTIPDYQEADFTQFLSDGSVTENLTVKDSAGSSYAKQIMVHIVDACVTEKKPDSTTRFINQYYYNQPYEAGGLLDTSFWKTKAEYITTLQSAFDNLNHNTIAETYVLSYDTRMQIREYIKQHGFGNSIESDALHEMYERFLAVNK